MVIVCQMQQEIAPPGGRRAVVLEVLLVHVRQVITGWTIVGVCLMRQEPAVPPVDQHPPLHHQPPPLPLPLPLPLLLLPPAGADYA